MIKLKILTADELRLFRKCDAFLWEVRCHLHFLTGRAEERLSFDVQKSLAERFNTTGSAGMKSVEKFMRQYFLVAKNVGDLTAIFCASLEEQQKKQRARTRLPALFQRQKQVHGFKFVRGRLTMARADCFRNDPVNLIRVFHLADRLRLDIHPDTLREITRSVGLIGPNGAGKSTFLKALAGVLPPSEGNLTVRGKVAPLIELGGGFNMELTGRENLYFNGSIMGRSRAEMDTRIEAISFIF